MKEKKKKRMQAKNQKAKKKALIPEAFNDSSLPGKEKRKFL
jgi:hypothetical protein